MELPEPASTPPLPASPAVRESPLREVFFGPNGPRAGARLLVYFALGSIVLLVLGTVVHFIEPYGRHQIWMGLVSELEMMSAVILAGVAMAGIEGRPFGDYGLPSSQAFGRLFWKGMGWGIVWITVLMLIMDILGVFHFGGLALHGVRTLKFGFYYALFFLVVGFFEEFLVRGYSLFALSGAIDYWPAAAVLSIGFGAIHAGNSGETRIGLVAAGLIGFFFCLTLRRTGSLWFAIGFHCSWDWGESYLYSVPDSGTTATGHLLNSTFHGPDWLTGGPVGPEGSVLVFLVIAAMWVVFDRMHPEVKYRG